MNVYQVYCLSGPDLVPRYVGLTRKGLRTRARQHQLAALRGERPLDAWVREQGGALVIRELQHIGDTCMKRASPFEREWIDRLATEGANLFNVDRRAKLTCVVMELEAKIA